MPLEPRKTLHKLAAALELSTTTVYDNLKNLVIKIHNGKLKPILERE